LSSADILWRRGGEFLDAESAFFGVKNFGFFEIYGVSAWAKEKEFKPVRTFFGQGKRGSIFPIL